MAKILVYPVDTGEKRYTCNGVLEVNGTPAQMLDSILNSMDGSGVYSQGVWSIWAAGPATPETDVIDESWLNGGISFKRGSNKNEKINTAGGTYINPDDHWAATGFPSVSIPAYVTEDQEELTADLTLNFCTSGFQAQRMGRLAIERSRSGMVVTYPCNLKALQVKVNEVRKVNNTLLGWTQKLFRVLDWQFSVTGGINLTLGEYNAAIYDVSSSDMQPIPTPDPTTLPDPWTVPSPIGLTATESLYATNVASVIMCRVDLSWAQPSVGISLYEVEQNSGAGWIPVGQSPTETCTLWDIQPGSQQFRVRAVNGLGVKSEWATLNYTVLGKTAPPADITSFTLHGTTLRWSPVADIDLAGYEIRYHVGNRVSWGDAIPMHTGLLQASPYQLQLLPSGPITIMIKALDTSGNYSQNVATILANLGDLVVRNVIETVDFKALGWPTSGALMWNPTAAMLMWAASDGTAMWQSALTDGSIVGSTLQADDRSGVMWSMDASVAKWLSDGNPMWPGSYYADMHYNVSVTFDASVLGGRLLFDYTATGNRIAVNYRPQGPSPMWSNQAADSMWHSDPDQFMWNVPAFMPWPGSVPVTADTYDFEIQTGFGPVQGTISELQVIVDVEDISEVLPNVSISAAGTRLTLAKTYRVIKVVNLTQQFDGGACRRMEVVDKDASAGPLIKAYDSSNAATTGHADVIVQGY